jgi:hypothetical protein
MGTKTRLKIAQNVETSNEDDLKIQKSEKSEQSPDLS